MLEDRVGPGARRIGPTAGEDRMTRPVVLRLADRHREVRHLVHHVQESLTREPVVERAVAVVWSEPTLRSEGKEKERLQIGGRPDLGAEVLGGSCHQSISPAVSASATCHGSGMYFQMILST